MNDLTKYLESPLWLAPMAGITDRAFRTLCLRYGAGLTYSEMVSAKGLEYNGVKTFALTDPAEEEPVLAVQLFGGEPDCMARQAFRVQERLGDRLALIDVNMGCPVRKVVRRGEGSALMNEPLLAANIIKAIVAETDVPVTAKFRSGWTNEEKNAVEFAKGLEQAGASLLAVHGRSARQMYRGAADWDVIAQVKEAVDVPVAGSGDVFSHQDALNMQERCGVDAVMVARGSRGNPWIFSGHEPTGAERMKAMREHFDLYLHYAVPLKAEDGRLSVSAEELAAPLDTPHPYLSPLRAQLSWYVRGLPNAAALRRSLSEAKSIGDFERIFALAQDLIDEQGEGPAETDIEGGSTR